MILDNNSNEMKKLSTGQGSGQFRILNVHQLYCIRLALKYCLLQCEFISKTLFAIECTYNIKCTSKIH